MNSCSSPITPPTVMFSMSLSSRKEYSLVTAKLSGCCVSTAPAVMQNTLRYLPLQECLVHMYRAMQPATLTCAGSFPRRKWNSLSIPKPAQEPVQGLSAAAMEVEVLTVLPVTEERPAKARGQLQTECGLKVGPVPREQPSFSAYAGAETHHGLPPGSVLWQRNVDSRYVS